MTDKLNLYLDVHLTFFEIAAIDSKILITEYKTKDSWDFESVIHDLNRSYVVQRPLQFIEFGPALERIQIQKFLAQVPRHYSGF